MPDSENAGLEGLGSSRFGDVPIEIMISVGVARPLIRDLVEIDEDAVLELDRALDDPVELFVGNKLIALGQLEEVDGDGSGKLGDRITEVKSLETNAP